MLRVLPPSNKNLATLFVARQVRTWVVKRATSPRFAAKSQNKLHVLVARFTVALQVSVGSAFYRVLDH